MEVRTMTLNYKDQLGFDVKLDNVRESISKATEGIVNIKGKNYSTVGLRLNKLREHFGVGISIKNIIIENTDDKVCVETQIYLNTENGRLFLANGFAEKKRALNFITKTACLEFCQTTAMGRACAGLGIIGDHNIASAEEIYGTKDESVPDKNINKE
tara:strand:+ start:2730 stop:3200 length:471 start_codon:yes stop_codon:yes gene_type:complete